MSNPSLENAILGIFSGQNLPECNKFIYEYTETQESWNGAIQLFNSSNEYVQYFAANIIYVKIKKHWFQLDQQKREELITFLLQYVNHVKSHPHEINSKKAFLSRIILALCCLSVRIPDGAKQYGQLSFDTFIDFSTPNDILALEMLILMPEELQSLDASRHIRQDVSTQMMEISTRVLALTDSIAQLVLNPNNISRNYPVASALRLIKGWINYGISLECLFFEHESTWQLMFHYLLNTPNDAGIIREACLLISDLITVESYPRDSKRDQIIEFMINSWLKSASNLAPLFSEGNEALINELLVTLLPSNHIMENSIILLQNPEGLEKLYDFIHLALKTYPQVLIALPSWPQIMSASLDYLAHCREKGTIRALLNLHQFILLASVQPIQGDTNLSIQLLTIEFNLMRGLLFVCFNLLNGQILQIIWTSVIDTIISIIRACDALGKAEELKGWLYEIFAASDQENIFQALNQLDREIAFQSILRLYMTNHRRLKALLKDIAKIGSGEQTSEVLSCYIED